MELERIALQDDYFIEKKLYPNIDFYSGITLRAMGFPTSMFTVLFALARTVGWIAQWKEMIEDPEQKIGRPRQLYTGADRAALIPSNAGTWSCRAAELDAAWQPSRGRPMRLGVPQLLVEEGRLGEAAVRPQRVARHAAELGPAAAAVEPIAGAAGFRVEHQQRTAVSHERPARPRRAGGGRAPAGAADEHQHLADLGAMRLVRLLREHQQGRRHQPPPVVADEQPLLVRCEARQLVAPVE